MCYNRHCQCLIHILSAHSGSPAALLHNYCIYQWLPILSTDVSISTRCDVHLEYRVSHECLVFKVIKSHPQPLSEERWLSTQVSSYLGGVFTLADSQGHWTSVAHSSDLAINTSSLWSSSLPFSFCCSHTVLPGITSKIHYLTWIFISGSAFRGWKIGIYALRFLNTFSSLF